MTFPFEHGRSERALERLASALEAIDFRGWDAYDGLTAPVIDRGARGHLMRTVAMQVFKRSPVNLRGLARTPREQHTKGIALAVSAYSRLAAADDNGRFARRLPQLVELLEAKSVPVGDVRAWAYEFHMHARWGEYRAGKPNAVATSFAGHALLDAMEVDDRSAHADMARDGFAYCVDELLIEADGERYFGYYRGQPTPIHNASVMLAALGARCHEPGSEQWSAAADAMAYTIARQRPDGSWPYGEGPRLGWVDGFHTAYVLESLHRWYERSGDRAALEALTRGLDLYLTELIDPDGAARDTLSSRYPIDIHGAATAITTLSVLAPYDERAWPAATRVVEWTLDHMQRDDGRFAFQQHRRWRNPIPYIRWGDGHMLLALATYVTVARSR